MAERLFDYDPLTGAKEYFEYDPVTDRFSIRREEDHEAILAQNHALRKHDTGWKGEMHHIGSIPLSVYYEQLVKTQRIHDQSALKKWWNSTDQEVFKTKRGWL